MKTLTIMAGGLSRRMGKDKAFLELNGEPFIKILHSAAEDCFDRVIISARDEEQKERIKSITGCAEIVADIYKECGPVGGIVSVYDSLGIEKTAVIPVDVPFADMDVLIRLFDACGERAFLLKDESGRVEPLIGAYGSSALSDLKRILKAGKYKLTDILKEEDTVISVDEFKKRFPDIAKCDFKLSFRNVNTIEEYNNII